MRLGTKPGAVHNGGLTLFGKSFGNSLQDTVVTSTCQVDVQALSPARAGTPQSASKV